MSDTVESNNPEILDIENLLLETIRSLYARDMQVIGLPDLPVAQLRVLNVLGRREEERGPTMGELAESLGITVSTAAQLVERIEKRGLVLRQHSDPDDRRIVRLCLTEPGRQLVAERRRLRHERLAAALERLTKEQKHDLKNALGPLAKAAAHISQTVNPSEAGLLSLLQEVR